MRILVVATTYPRTAGDTLPTFVDDLSQRYAAHGHDVRVVAPHDQGAARSEVFGRIEVRRFRYFAPDSAQVLAYRGGILNQVRASPAAAAEVPFFGLAMLRAVQRSAHEHQADAIHSHWIVPCGLAGAAAAHHRRHVVTMHAGDVAGLARLPGRTHIARYVLRRSDRVVGVSAYVSRRFRDILAPADRAAFDAKSAIIPMGVDTNALSEGPRSDLSGATLLFVGRLVEKKGVAVALDALQRSRDRDARLVVCGSGPLRATLEAHARRIGVASRVEFLGHIDEERKRQLLRARPILLIPSLVTQSGDVEGLPVVLLEGLAAGCAVIASDSGGTAEAIRHGETGLVVPPGSSEALASAIDQLLSDAALRRKLSTAAQGSAMAYDWERISRAYEELLE